MSGLSNVLATLEKGVQFAESLLPEITAVFPAAGAVGGMLEVATKAAGAVTDVVENVQARIAEGKIVANSSDQAQIRDLAQRLHDLNDQLATQVDDS